MIPAPLKLEFFKWTRSPLWILLALLVAFLLKGLVLLAAKIGAYGQMTNGFEFLAASAKHTVLLLGFLLCLLAGAAFSSEYSRGILRMHLARPTSRGAYFASRSLFFAALALVLLLIDALAGMVMGWAGFGFADVVDPDQLALYGEDLFSSRAMTRSAIQVYLLTYLGVVGTASVGMLVSVIFRSPTVSIGVTGAAFFLMEGVRLIFRDPTRSFVVTRYISVHLDNLSLLAAQSSAGQPHPDFLARSVTITLAYFILANMVGFFLFRRMDVLD